MAGFRGLRSRGPPGYDTSARQGLGLAIVKGIVELHRGTAAVVSQPGPDTTVTLTVPG